jgi:2-methylcitrate dehydratase PrpD
MDIPKERGPRLETAKKTDNTICDAFAEFSVQTRYEKIPSEVIHQAKRCILDFFGVALAGSSVGIAPCMSALFRDMGGTPEATFFGESGKFPALNAALVNAAKGHTLDMDDGHRYANAHPGVPLIPAAVAIAERDNRSGKQLIEGVVVGYETFIHIARAINPKHLERGFHTTGTVGTFGAAAACAKILQLGQKETADAISIAGLQSAGLLEVLKTGQIMKPLHPAKASHAGLLSALLAGKGNKGPDPMFEGNNGFLKAYAGVSASPEITAGLGKQFEITNVYFKLHAACRHVHPALDAIGIIMGKHKVPMEKISSIKVYTYSIANKLTGQIRKVENELEAKFSLPISIGLMLRYGKAGVDQYDMTFIKDKMVQQMADKVEIIVEPERDAIYPKQRGARICIETPDLSFSEDVPVPKGDPENPFSDDELIEKFLFNAKKTMSEKSAMELSDKIFNMEKFSVRELISCMSGS